MRLSITFSKKIKSFRNTPEYYLLLKRLLFKFSISWLLYNVKYALINFIFIINTVFYRIFKIVYIFLHSMVHCRMSCQKRRSCQNLFIFYFLFLCIIALCILQRVNSYVY